MSSRCDGGQGLFMVTVWLQGTETCSHSAVPEVAHPQDSLLEVHGKGVEVRESDHWWGHKIPALSVIHIPALFSHISLQVMLLGASWFLLFQVTPTVLVYQPISFEFYWKYLVSSHKGEAEMLLNTEALKSRHKKSSRAPRDLNNIVRVPFTLLRKISQLAGLNF